MCCTSALVLDLCWVVQLEEDIVDWFVTLAVSGLDAGSVDVLDVSINALASGTAGFSRWTLEVLHCLCLTGLSACALNWNLTTGACFLDWFWFNWWEFLAGCTTCAWNHDFLLCVWVADFAGLWLVNQLVVNADVFNAWLLGRWSCISGLEDRWWLICCCIGHDALAVSCLDA
jgi:hypothetical protein